MKTSTKFALIGIIFALLLISGGGCYHMNQFKKELMVKKWLIEIAAPQIDEFYKWNYLGVKTTKVTVLERNPVDGSPYGEVELTLDHKKKASAMIALTGTDLSFGTFSERSTPRPDFKVAEAGNDAINHNDYILQIKDIKKLKKSGYTEKISGQEIKYYLFKTYPEKFKGIGH